MRRDPRLVPLSREHHAPLRLGRQLIAGQGRDALRDMLPALTTHFSEEELSLAPLLRAGGETLLAERLLAEHRALAALFAVVLEGDREAEAGRALIDHVRFEERELFPAVEALLEPEGVL
ncbi:MAG: hemerythrin domain-containing protein [Rhodocyclaceae bacterium]|nr:hemerythrin domain-containing protein [Rhodocyclaceae bacterium]MCP5234128.1 hemerythrin domain-containing protein [Zoogloeaceae bacterium]